MSKITDILRQRIAQAFEGEINFIYGDKGVVMETIRSYGEGKVTTVISGRHTALQFYTMMYERREGVILIDGVEPLRDRTVLDLIMRSTDVGNGRICRYASKRKIQYRDANDEIVTVPHEFNFNGCVIILLGPDDTIPRSLSSVWQFIIDKGHVINLNTQH